MAITGYVEVWEGRGGTGSWPNKRTYTREFQVRSNLANEASNAVVNALTVATGIRQGRRHPEDVFAYCVRIDARQQSEDATLWRVAVEYDSHPDIKTDEATDASGDAPQPKENPLLKPPVWKYGFDKVTRAVAKDNAGYPIQNSARLPFDPPLTVERSRPTFTITRNLPSFSPGQANQFQDAVNVAAWRGMGARTLRVTQLEANSGFENGVSFVTLSCTISINPDTWDVQILNAGYSRRIDNGAGETPRYGWAKIKDRWGQDITEPVPLDNMGQPLNPDADPIFRFFRVYPEQDFTKLFF